MAAGAVSKESLVDSGSADMAIRFGLNTIDKSEYVDSGVAPPNDR